MLRWKSAHQHCAVTWPVCQVWATIHRSKYIVYAMAVMVFEASVSLVVWRTPLIPVISYEQFYVMCLQLYWVHFLLYMYIMVIIIYFSVHHEWGVRFLSRSTTVLCSSMTEIGRENLVKNLNNQMKAIEKRLDKQISVISKYDWWIQAM